MRDAIAVVLKRGNTFLLIKRAKKGEAEDYWCPITGVVEDGESQESAVVREAAEEMGLTVRPLRKVWQCYTDDQEYVLHWWFAELLEEHIETNKEEVKEYKWTTVEEMNNLSKMFSADRHFFKEIAQALPG